MNGSYSFTDDEFIWAQSFRFLKRCEETKEKAIAKKSDFNPCLISLILPNLSPIKRGTRNPLDVVEKMCPVLSRYSQITQQACVQIAAAMADK